MKVSQASVYNQVSSQKIQIRAKQDIDINELNEIAAKVNLRIRTCKDQTLPSISHEFNKNDLEEHRNKMEECKRVMENESERLRKRNTRGRQQEQTQTQRIEICFDYAVLGM